jgi:hypothetical protein
METSDDKELILHYIDKIHSVQMDTVRRTNSIFAIQTIFALLLIAYCTGIISVDEQIAFGGMKINVASQFFLLGGAYLIGVLYIHYLGLSMHRHRITDTIIQLYATFNFADRREAGETVLIEPAEIINTTLSPKRFGFPHASPCAWNTVGVPFTIALFLLPLFAQILAAYRMIKFFGWEPWVTIPFIILLAVIFIYLISFIQEASHEEERRWQRLFESTSGTKYKSQVEDMAFEAELKNIMVDLNLSNEYDKKICGRLNDLIDRKLRTIGNRKALEVVIQRELSDISPQKKQWLQGFLDGITTQKGKGR